MTTTIRVRAALAVIEARKILLVPHYNTEIAPILWYIPGGAIRFGESLQEAAAREFFEETGLQARIGPLLDIYEAIHPQKPWHSITVTFQGHMIGGQLSAETTSYGDKMPRWFSQDELQQVHYHTVRAVEAAFAASPT